MINIFSLHFYVSHILFKSIIKTGTNYIIFFCCKYVLIYSLLQLPHKAFNQSFIIFGTNYYNFINNFVQFNKAITIGYNIVL